MAKDLKIGDRVSWNSEAGMVTGIIIKVHTKDFDYKGYTHHATKEEPQYEIKSEKSDHIAAHKGQALTKLHN
jgi:Hypervirulence associated proteins TUDOR domain